MPGPNSMDKPWFPTFLVSLHGLPFIEQAIGLWLAYTADNDGVIDDIDWEQLSHATNVSLEHLKQTLRNRDLNLYEDNILEREDRAVGKQTLKPLFRLTAATKNREPQPA